MKTSFLFRPRVRQVTTIVLLLIAVSTMVPADTPLVAWWVAQAKWVALGYLVFAMALLGINRTRLMFVCLGCSAAISLFYHETKTAGSPRVDPKSETPVLEKKDTSTHEYTPSRR